MSTYDPTTGASLLDLQQRISMVKSGKVLADMPAIIDRFEADYRVYTQKVGKELDDLTKQNILLQALPVQWEKNLMFQMHFRGKEMVYSTLRHEILDLVIQADGPMATGTDVDVLSRGEHRGVGGQEPPEKPGGEDLTR